MGGWGYGIWGMGFGVGWWDGMGGFWCSRTAGAPCSVARVLPKTAATNVAAVIRRIGQIPRKRIRRIGRIRRIPAGHQPGPAPSRRPLTGATCNTLFYA